MEVFIGILVIGAFGGFIAWRMKQKKVSGNLTGGSTGGGDTPPKNKS